jgi:hypothetical protein
MNEQYIQVVLTQTPTIEATIGTQQAIEATITLNGADGRNIELQSNSTHIQWRYVGDVTWTDLVALEDLQAEDKHFSVEFSDTSEVLVEHNLGKLPAVSIHDTAGDEVEGDVEHLSTNEFRVRFSANNSGIITAN